MNLPATSVRDLEVKGVDLVVATHGRGFWILDDLSSLRQLDVAAPMTTRLFAPAPAVRLRPEGFTGTPFPKDEPARRQPAGWRGHRLRAGVRARGTGRARRARRVGR